MCACAATGELADVSLEYLPASTLALEHKHLPDAPRWPEPAEHQRWPFDGGLVDYLRPVGPGVFVGVGWYAREAGRRKYKQFLYFVLARAY